MRKFSRLCAGYALLCSQIASAQPSVQPPTSAGAKGFVQVAPSGAMLDTAATVRFQIATDVVRQGDSLAEILRRNSLQDTPATIEAVRKLNPTMSYNLGKPKVGEPLVLFKPEFALGANARVDLTEPAFTKAIVSTRREEVIRTRVRADALGANAFEHPSDSAAFRAATADLVDTATKLEQASDKLDPRQLALSAFYLEQANMAVSRVAGGPPTASGKWSKDATFLVDKQMKPLRAIQKSIVTTGAPFPIRRKVTVQVVDGAGTRVDHLRVYVLPTSAIDLPHAVSDATMLGLLRLFSFEKPTSPSSRTLEAADLAVWVGPDFAHEKMLEMVKRRAIKKYFVVSSGDVAAGDVTHSFISPKDITKP